MTLFNNTESILSIKEPCSYKNGVILPNNGVILPHSERILFMGDIDKKIAKTKNELNYLTYAQAQRSTHGGKKFRAKRISQQNQIQSCSERLSLLVSAKNIIIKMNTEDNERLRKKVNVFAAGIFNSISAGADYPLQSRLLKGDVTVLSTKELSTKDKKVVSAASNIFKKSAGCTPVETHDADDIYSEQTDKSARQTVVSDPLDDLYDLYSAQADK